MDAFYERRTQDLNKLRKFAASSNGRVKVVKSEGNPINRIDIELYYKTVGSTAYPAVKQEISQIEIALSTRYPFQEPTVNIGTPILHPNIFSSGKICLGTKWLPTDGLDLLLRRVIQIVTFDASILNEESPANMTALEWYRTALRKYPSAFPTDRFEPFGTERKMAPVWKDIPNTSQTKVVLSCPACAQKMRVPINKSGTLECIRCKVRFEAQT